ncbi:nucleoporin protein Ndc1-Nup-domain-containing protein [Tricharina praecox]|uniref:nucleoporin protein Ndc1-Nup-domain-containing protein n=1 Tax=Tricharina praecox TaxID=43433 RepID=UPI0022209D23|nr:nucleoporin protein Ndc1-Nup-domain-containing protein [Tricharina praecox]XP_051343665.1 nucleoporin protein Ndc1-Nup-domain-containing protein [Tricharina praecox]KAI5841293.1 nucleoporin protein Ndc1-Nup-domain-containing protein [Tricharina praecox]KAI5857919.1 nucleoporin protein Ndc1-Nup-domain-containing protein [Tricharina praecox]
MVQSISRSLPTPAARPPPPHYQTILTPLLHRRFAHACLISLGFCYLEAIIISDKSNFFWVLFPISMTGLKCFVLFFLSAMPLLILRIAQLHVVKRAHSSPFHAFQRAIGSFATYSAIFTYVLSSVVFMTLYLLSCGPEDQLGVVVEGRSYERPRLNERFLYLVFFSVFIGVFRGCAHVYYDRARLVFPEVPYASYKDAGAAQIPTVAWNVGYYVSFFSIFGPLVYFPFRYILWSHTLAFARHFYWLNRSAALPSFPVGPTLFIRSCFLALMIVLSSEVSHAAFNAFFTEDPFQGGKTITDKSSDPNGTLITGLRTAKAPLTQVRIYSRFRRNCEWLTVSTADGLRGIEPHCPQPSRPPTRHLRRCRPQAIIMGTHP